MYQSLISLTLCCTWIAGAADTGITNAFEDLKHQGTIREEDSPMRVGASTEAMEALIQSEPEAQWFCFPDQREMALRDSRILPKRWADMSSLRRGVLTVKTSPGEYFVYQLGLFAARADMKDVSVEFSPLKNDEGQEISPRGMTCFNAGGVDVYGKPFHRAVNVVRGNLQSLWIGVDIPDSAFGPYKGTVTITPRGGLSRTVAVTLDVQGLPVQAHGDDEGYRMSRLRWLNSSIGHGDKPTAPYTPLAVIPSESGTDIQYLGGVLRLGRNGLPSMARTFYNEANTLVPRVQNDILADGMRLVVETDKGPVTWTSGELKVARESDGKVVWTAQSVGSGMELICTGTFEFDGFSDIRLNLMSDHDLDVKDVRLEVPFTEYASKYFMGLGRRGGFFPEKGIDWKWNVEKKHQDSFWIGNVNAGMRMLFKGDGYKRPLVNVYYKYGRLRLPESWGNGGEGGIRIAPDGKGKVLAGIFTGPRTLKAGKSLDFNMELLITPVKPLDWKHQVEERYYHSNSDVSSEYVKAARDKGANIINIHHKKDIYPFINYPYYDASVGDLKSFIGQAHQEGLKVKAYYTTREISIKIPEIWAMRSLGGEIIMDGPGKDAATVTNPKGPDKWLVDNFGTHFVPAWHNAFNHGKYAGEMDLSVLTTPDSRWNNYYLEGLDWMVRNIGLDGIYIDDSALDRESMKRGRRVLDADGKRRSVDMHSWNHMNAWAGYANSLLIYADLFPFIDRLWIGEGFSPNSSPDFWMVEISGIPFGIMSETLNSHNYWRGMIHGMTPRLGWSGDPSSIWKIYDALNMAEARMLGYWNPSCPVIASSPDVKATAYVMKDKALVVLANWTNKDVDTVLTLDAGKLGFVPGKASLPDMPGIQNMEASIDLSSPLSLKGGKGMFILLEK